MTAEDHCEAEIDATGLRCPLPVLKLQKRLRSMASGEKARLLSTDPSSKKDVDAFCAETGHTLVSSETDSDLLTYIVRKC